MTSLLLLRRDATDARAAQAALEATRDLRVAGVVTTLRAARLHLRHLRPDALLTDLSLEDGPALALLAELRRSAPPYARPRVMLISPVADDPLLFGSLSAGADSYVLDGAPTGLLPVALRRMVRGEAVMSAPIALQALKFFGVTQRAQPSINERTLDWDHGAADPLHLSRGEQHMLALLAEGESPGSIAVRLALSIESIGRRISNIYRKLQWDVQSGALALHPR